MFNVMQSDAADPAQDPKPETPRRPTARQVAAVYEVMRLLRRDRAGGPENQFVCDRCGRERDRSGSVAYGELVFCNGCAIDYELLLLTESSRRGPAPVPPSGSTK
jgi:hypothetical protein